MKSRMLIILLSIVASACLSSDHARIPAHDSGRKIREHTVHFFLWGLFPVGSSADGRETSFSVRELCGGKQNESWEIREYWLDSSWWQHLVSPATLWLWIPRRIKVDCHRRAETDSPSN